MITVWLGKQNGVWEICVAAKVVRVYVSEEKARAYYLGVCETLKMLGKLGVHGIEKDLIEG